MNYKTFGIIILAICIVSGASYLTANVLASTLQVSVQLLPQPISPGEMLTIRVLLTNYFGTPIEEATVTATIGDLEIIYLLISQPNGYYEVTINTPIMTPGTYEITVTGQKEGFNLVRVSSNLIISAID